MKDNLAFQFESNLRTVEETEGLTYVTGLLISEGRSTNDREYSLGMISDICKQAISKPLTFGTVKKMDSNGIVKVLHNEENIIGRIVKTWRKGTKVFFKALVSDPDLAKRINENFGVSVGGVATEYSIVQEFGRKILKLIKMIVTHVAIVSPEISTGFPEAKVHAVVHESRMTFYKDGLELTDDELTGIISALQKTGEI